MYAILIEDNFGISRNKLREKLKENGVGTRKFFIPMHRQPIFKTMGIAKGFYPITDEISKRGLYLPSSSCLTKQEIKYICNVIKKIGQLAN